MTVRVRGNDGRGNDGERAGMTVRVRGNDGMVAGVTVRGAPFLIIGVTALARRPSKFYEICEKWDISGHFGAFVALLSSCLAAGVGSPPLFSLSPYGGEMVGCCVSSGGGCCVFSAGMLCLFRWDVVSLPLGCCVSSAWGFTAEGAEIAEGASWALASVGMTVALRRPHLRG